MGEGSSPAHPEAQEPTRSLRTNDAHPTRTHHNRIRTCGDAIRPCGRTAVEGQTHGGEIATQAAGRILFVSEYDSGHRKDHKEDREQAGS
jgi:hypothetical protein